MSLQATGQGPTGAKLARWINKVLVGPLIKFIFRGRGITVQPTDNGGVIISTNAPMFEYFYLPSIDDVARHDNKHARGFDYRIGRSLSAGRSPGDTDANYADAPSTSTPNEEIHFLYTTGWFPRGCVVRCEDTTGVWECISTGIRYIGGTVDSADGSDWTVTLSGSGGRIGIETEVTARAPWFDVAPGDEVGMDWCDPDQIWDITKKVCPPP